MNLTAIKNSSSISQKLLNGSDMILLQNQNFINDSLQ